MSGDRPAVDLEAEREVDLRSWWGRITDRWWLPVGGAVVGVVLGVLVSLSGGQVYEASTLLYLGQPFAPNGGGQIQSLQTNPRTVSEIVRSEGAVRRAATAAGMRPGQLRGNIATRTVVSPGQAARSQSPLQEITVQAPTRAKAQEASASLAKSVVDTVSPFVQNKMRLLQRQIDDDNEALTTATKRIEAALDQQASLQDSDLSLSDRLIIQSNINNTLQFYEGRLVSLRIDRTNAEQLLSLAERVEKSFVVEQPVARKTSATGARNGALVGGVIGLLLGALAAVVADPVLARRRGTARDA
jgi:uncharacterized protein involved in exopolysaccharide biosynthesis